MAGTIARQLSNSVEEIHEHKEDDSPINRGYDNSNVNDSNHDNALRETLEKLTRLRTTIYDSTIDISPSIALERSPLEFLLRPPFPDVYQSHVNSFIRYINKHIDSGDLSGMTSSPDILYRCVCFANIERLTTENSAIVDAKEELESNWLQYNLILRSNGTLELTGEDSYVNHFIISHILLSTCTDISFKSDFSTNSKSNSNFLQSINKLTVLLQCIKEETHNEIQLLVLFLY